LNYFRPPKNKNVFWVAEAAFLSTSFKYCGAVIMKISADPATRDTLGAVLMVADCLVMFAGIGGAVGVLWNLKQKVRKLQGPQPSVAPRKLGMSAVPGRERKHTKVTRGLTLKYVEKAVANEKLAVFEEQHYEQRKEFVAQMQKREKAADRRVRQRVIERRKRSSLKQQQQQQQQVEKQRQVQSIRSWKIAPGPPPPVTAVAVAVATTEGGVISPAAMEKCRLAIRKRIKSVQNLQAAFAKLDIEHSGMLSMKEFARLLQAVMGRKKKLKTPVIRALWDAAWEQRKHGLNDEIDAPTVAHWLEL
jgi:hypothetical protein